MSKQTIQQERAKHALEHVQKWMEKENDKDQGKIRSYASDLPAMILMNGIGQALAFCKSKKDPNYTNLYNALADWLTASGRPLEKFRGKELITTITAIDMQMYQQAQTESLIYLDWVKKFAKAFLKEDK